MHASTATVLRHAAACTHLITTTTPVHTGSTPSGTHASSSGEASLNL